MASKAAAEPANGAVKDPEQEQQKQAGLAREAVQKQSYYMKRAIDEGNMRDALKHSSAMLGELRTSKLTPPNYYELYMRVFDELQMLSVFFAEDVKNGRNVSELYELVQHASHIVPRMYLLCTVGSVYIQTKEAPARDVLKDLVEMCRGVQHPIRGLFLRSYLAQTCKKLLPDVGSEYEGAGGTVEDAIDFVLQNFTEMNKLWVRMQQQGRATERAGREKERRELRELVGRNLVVLSQLDGVTLQAYSSTVLPRVLEQIVNCKDEIAQFYLMDAVIQVFSDDFHLHTLDTLLQAVPQLQIGVDVVTIMNRLMERLAAYASSSGELMAELIEVQAFEKLRSAVNEVVVSYGDGLPLESVIMLHAALLSFALHCYRDELQYVNSVLESAAKVLSKTPNISDTSVVRSIVKLLTKPLEAYKDVCTVLELSSYPQVAGTLQFVTAKAMAIEVINAILSSGTIISQVVQVEKLFSFLRLLVDNDEIPEDEEIDEEELEEEQVLVSKVLHQLWNDDTDVCFEILECIRTHLLKGGPERTVYTLSPLAFLALRLERLPARRVHGFTTLEQVPEATVRLASACGRAVRERVKAGNTLKVSVKKVLQFLHSTLEILVNQCDAYEIGLRLLLLSAESAAQAGKCILPDLRAWGMGCAPNGALLVRTGGDRVRVL
eukprot:scaffold2229_cov413-Prasinococcus_capsulatus_cf.AAC.14